MYAKIQVKSLSWSGSVGCFGVFQDIMNGLTKLPVDAPERKAILPYFFDGI